MSIDTHIIRASSAHRAYVDRILTAAIEMARGDGYHIIAECRRGSGGEHEYWLGAREQGRDAPPAVTGALGVSSAAPTRCAEPPAQATGAARAARAVPQPPVAPSKPLWPNDRPRSMRLIASHAAGRSRAGGGAA